MKQNGFFISFEGPEGSGKSSQARRLAAALRRRGYRVVLVRDPGSTAVGRALRRALLHSRHALSPMAEAMLFLAGRIQLVQERIRPALEAGRIVICDRFHDSTVVYQGFGGQLDVRWLDRLGRRAIGRCLPDLTLVLDVPTQVGLRRHKRQKDRMERNVVAFHRRVRQGYLRLAQAQPRRFVVLDGTCAKDSLHRQTDAIVSKRLKLR